MKKYKINIFRHSWDIYISSVATWDNIVSEGLNANELRKNFVYPWIAICVLTVCIFDSLYAQGKGMEAGVLNGIISAVSLLGGYFLSNKICFWYLRKQLKTKQSEVDCERIVTYSFLTIYILSVITTIFPGLFFLQILSVYIAFVIWEGCRAVLKLNEDERGNIVLVFTVVIIFIPVLISKLIHFIVPNT
jgi:hypothetical protein